jgi:hypothetical protein
VELQRVHLDAERGNVLLLELARQVALRRRVSVVRGGSKAQQHIRLCSARQKCK